MFLIDLYPYQSDDVDRMVKQGRMLVAYEMGLGKTTMTIAAIEDLMGRDLVTQSVIICGASLRYQWASKIAEVTDVAKRTVKVNGNQMTIPATKHCIIVEGNAQQRAKLYAQAIKERTEYVIFGYEGVVNDWERVRKLSPDCIVLDEATAIKSFKAKRSRKIKRMEAPYRFALTGTPIDNGKPEEVFSIMQWVDETILGRFDLFDKTYIIRNNFGGVKYYKNLHLFREKLSAALCRKKRTDPDVAPFMPEVEEEEAYVELDAKSRKLYNTIAKELVKELARADKGWGFDVEAHYKGESTDDGDKTIQGRISMRLQAMEMLSCHPQLIRWSAEKYESGNGDGSRYCWELVNSGALEGLNGSTKFDEVISDAHNILEFAPENKLIIFSFFKGMIPLFKNEFKNYKVVEFHGDLNAAERGAAINEFQTNPECRVFISSHAGGFGVDLPAANYLFHYDVPWASGAYDQFSARHIRAGSKHENVYVRPYLALGTVDIWKYQGVQYKQRVAGAFIDGKVSKFGELTNDRQPLGDYLDTILNP